MLRFRQLLSVGAMLTLLVALPSIAQIATKASPGRVLLGESLLQRHLRVTDAQRAEMKRLETASDQEVSRLAREEADPAERRTRTTAIQARLDRQVLDLLTPAQRGQLLKIESFTGLGAGVAGALIAVEGLTAEQRRRLETLAGETVVKRVNLFYDFKFSESGPQAKSDPSNPQYAKQLRTLEDEAANAVTAILTPAQAKVFLASRSRKL